MNATRLRLLYDGLGYAWNEAKRLAGLGWITDVVADGDRWRVIVECPEHVQYNLAGWPVQLIVERVKMLTDGDEI